MYTIHNGINGGWYGSVQADDPDEAARMATELATVLSALRETNPRPERRAKPDTGTLNDKGRAVIAWLDAHPGANGPALWEEAKPTKRTFDWLTANGFIAANPDRTGFVVLKRS